MDTFSSWKFCHRKQLKTQWLYVTIYCIELENQYTICHGNNFTENEDPDYYISSDSWKSTVMKFCLNKNGIGRKVGKGKGSCGSLSHTQTHTCIKTVISF
jgi:hypothetical protein